MIRSLILFDLIKMCACGYYLMTEDATREKIQQYADAAGNDRYAVCEIDGDWRDHYLDDINASCIWQIKNKESEHNEQSREKQAQEN